MSSACGYFAFDTLTSCREVGAVGWTWGGMLNGIEQTIGTVPTSLLWALGALAFAYSAFNKITKRNGL